MPCGTLGKDAKNDYLLSLLLHVVLDPPSELPFLTLSLLCSLLESTPFPFRSLVVVKLISDHPQHSHELMRHETGLTLLSNHETSFSQPHRELENLIPGACGNGRASVEMKIQITLVLIRRTSCCLTLQRIILIYFLPSHSQAPACTQRVC